METKFKAGDRVRILFGCSGNKVNDERALSEKAGILYAGECSCPLNWELMEISAAKPGQAVKQAVRFILQYELDTDPFELFVTEKELRARIAELAVNPSLQRDSIKVYDIKRVRTVKLGVKITLK